MSQPIDPIVGAPIDRRSKERRDKERRKAEAAQVKSGLPVPVGPARTVKPAPAAPPAADAAFTAQVLGQSGQKRGLKGGPPVLEGARSAYLGAEWSGQSDRRPRPGRITKTEI